MWLVQVPASKGAILTGLELSLAKSWRTVIAVEFVAAANHGLGYAIWDAAEYLRFDVVASGIAIVMVGHWLLNRLVKVTGR
jgi:ABC-type nitrate/sulfonate/bicarbonate transport system permease component